MEKLQLYSPRRLCYNSLVLGVSRCTGQEISACREASLGRSKLGRSKLGRNGDCSGTSAPIRPKKKIGKINDSAETLTIFGGITLKTIRSNFAAGARAVPLKQRDEECHSANCVSFCVFVWSLTRRSSHRSCQPKATRPQEGQAVKRKNGFLSDRGGLRIQEKTPHETAAKVSPLRPGSVPEPAAQEQHTPRSAAGADQRIPATASVLSAAAAEFSGMVFTAAIADGRAHAPCGIVLTEAKVKRDRFRTAPQNGRRRKAFSPFKDLCSAEKKRKQTRLPTGEVRPSEHDNDF